ncbi:MAG: AMP-binding protein [Candidatus Velthaea sp.]
MTLPDFFRTAATAHAERTFIVDDAGEHTYAQTASRVRAMAARLHAAGIGRGDRVVVLMENHGGYIVTWFALATLGAILVAVNTELHGRTLSEIVEDSAARSIVVDAALVPKMHEALGADAGGRAVHRIEGPRELNALLDRDEQAAPAAPADFDDTHPLSILYTSGTTSRPKGAVSSHRAYVLSGGDMAANLDLVAGDRFYVFLPLYHANPQYYAVMSALAVGASLALARRFSLSRFWSDVSASGATLFTYVGTVLALLRQAPDPPAGHRLRGCVGGGAPADAWSHVEERWNVRVHELYGMTETGAFVTMNTPAASRFGSVGRARKATDVRVLAHGGATAAVDTAGEIVVRAHIPHAIFEGYVEANGTLDSGLHEGWLHTGDIGKFDADGYLYFIGRAKEMMRVRGENIAPAYLESLLRDCPAIGEAAAVGVPSPLGDDDLKLCIVPAGPPDPAAVYDWCERNLPRFMHPRFIEMRTSLPKTSTQKVERRKLVEHDSEAALWERPGR